MKKYVSKTPEEIITLVTKEIIERAIWLVKKINRIISISKTSGGKGIDVNDLNPKISEGKEKLEKFITPTRRHYQYLV